jgi:adenosine deaminase
MPKVDLYRRFDGALRYGTLLEIARDQAVDLDVDADELGRLILAARRSRPTSVPASYKLDVVQTLLRSETLIQRAAREIAEDALEDNLRYLELHLPPFMLAGSDEFHASQVVDWVLETYDDEPLEGRLQVGLILGLSRDEPVSQAERVVQIAVDRLGKGVLGVHLGDDEASLVASFEELLRQARAAGLGTSVEAGLQGDPESVLEATERLHAERILHGMSVMADPAVVQSALDHKVVFGVCLSSEVRLRIVESYSRHPFLAMLQSGLRLTLNTLNPVLTGSSLSEEYMLAKERFGISLETLKGIVLSGAQAAFLPDKARKILEKDLVRELFMPEEDGHADR